jgi:hypothetical protein
MSWRGQPEREHGRSEIFSDQAIQLCLSIKYLFNSQLRQTMGHDVKPAAWVKRLLSANRSRPTGFPEHFTRRAQRIWRDLLAGGAAH